MYKFIWFVYFCFLWHRYSPDAKIEAPRWACALCGLGLFIYQSLDAIDGKQARRTGTANPLGELFDHGCDSISTVFVALSACIAVQLGYYPGWMFFQVRRLVISIYWCLKQLYFSVFLCSHFVLLCPLADLRVGHFEIRQGGCYRSPVHYYGYFGDIHNIRSQCMVDKGEIP